MGKKKKTSSHIGATALCRDSAVVEPRKVKPTPTIDGAPLSATYDASLQNEMDELRTRQRYTEEKLRALTLLVRDKIATTPEVKAKFELLLGGDSSLDCTPPPQGTKPDSEPVSGPLPSSKGNDSTSPSLTNFGAISRRSACLLKNAHSAGKESPCEIGKESLSESSDEAGFRTRNHRKRSSTRKSVKHQLIKKRLFPSHRTVEEELIRMHEEVIFTDIPRPYGIQTKSLVDINPVKKGGELPEWMEVTFRPPKEMTFIGTELCVAAYIFKKGVDPKELIVSNDHCCEDRDAFQTLVPGSPLLMISLFCVHT